MQRLTVWLQHHRLSAFFVLAFHSSQATFTAGSFGFSGADTGRADLIYLGVVIAAALATVLLDCDAWQSAPAPAVGLRPWRFTRSPWPYGSWPLLVP